MWDSAVFLVSFSSLCYSVCFSFILDSLSIISFVCSDFSFSVAIFLHVSLSLIGATITVYGMKQLTKQYVCYYEPSCSNLFHALVSIGNTILFCSHIAFLPVLLARAIYFIYTGAVSRDRMKDLVYLGSFGSYI